MRCRNLLPLVMVVLLLAATAYAQDATAPASQAPVRSGEPLKEIDQLNTRTEILKRQVQERKLLKELEGLDGSQIPPPPGGDMGGGRGGYSGGYVPHDVEMLPRVSAITGFPESLVAIVEYPFTNEQAVVKKGDKLPRGGTVLRVDERGVLVSFKSKEQQLSFTRIFGGSEEGAAAAKAGSRALPDATSPLARFN